MPRFTPDDFGYDFASSSEEKESLVAATVGVREKSSTTTTTTTTNTPHYSSAVHQDDENAGNYELYRESSQQQEQEQQEQDLYKYHPAKRYRGGEGFVASPNGSMVLAGGSGTACVGATCCCITILLVLVGGILIAYQQYQNTVVLVGSILLVVAVASCLCACCLFCVGAIVDVETRLFGNNHNNDDDSPSGDSNYKEVKVRFRRLNDRYEKGCLKAESHLRYTRLDVVGHMPEVREALKKEAKEKMEQEKKNRKELEDRVKKDLEAGISVQTIRRTYRPLAFLIVFDGDISVSNLELLRKQVSLVVNLAKKNVDQCVIVLTSPGGAVSQYGLAASQLVRIRKAGIKLVVCIDSVAASGGYMMASVANTICAAPFAIVGSIGVVTHIPNFQRFLEDKKIDAYLMTAGQYKRTIDFIGEVTEEGKAKLTEELDDVHIAFKDHVAFARPQLKETIEEIATGEHWLAVQAKEKGLVDVIMTSDEYLESVSSDYDIIEILEKKPKPSVWKDWKEAALSAKSVMSRFESAVEAPEKSPLPMAIV